VGRGDEEHDLLALARAEVDVVRALLHDDQAMSDPDIAILRSVADDYDAAGPQFSTLSALFRRVATKLENAHAPDTAIRPPATVPVVCVDSDDGVPGVRCVGFGCED